MPSRRWRRPSGANWSSRPPPATTTWSKISVADTGAGIAPEMTAQLFQPFVTTKRQGMGVGLSISRTIVEAHGGQIWAEPNPGGGTVFSFTLRAVTKEEVERCRLRSRRSMSSMTTMRCASRSRSCCGRARIEVEDLRDRGCGLPGGPARASRAGCVITDVRMPGHERYRSAAALARTEGRRCRSSSSPAMATCRWRSRR